MWQLYNELWKPFGEMLIEMERTGIRVLIDMHRTHPHHKHTAEALTAEALTAEALTAEAWSLLRMDRSTKIT